MHSLHIFIILFGVVTSALVVALYYWAQGRLTSKDSYLAFGFGGLLGLVAIGATYDNYFVFIVLFSSYIAGFLYLKNNAEFNLQTETAMASMFMGAVIGFSGLLGCIVCHS